MSDKIYAVKTQSYSSYDGLSSSYEIVSLHRTEKGANDAADKLRRDVAIYAITNGNLDEESDPDTVLGQVDDEDWSAALKTELSKPGATLMPSVQAVIEMFHIDAAEIKVTTQDVHE